MLSGATVCWTAGRWACTGQQHVPLLNAQQTQNLQQQIIRKGNAGLHGDCLPACREQALSGQQMRNRTQEAVCCASLPGIVPPLSPGVQLPLRSKPRAGRTPPTGSGLHGQRCADRRHQTGERWRQAAAGGGGRGRRLPAAEGTNASLTDRLDHPGCARWAGKRVEEGRNRPQHGHCNDRTALEDEGLLQASSRSTRCWPHAAPPASACPALRAGMLPPRRTSPCAPASCEHSFGFVRSSVRV